MNIQKILIKFITEARRKGFSDLEIRKAILSKGYPKSEIEKTFLTINPTFKLKNEICLFLNKDIIQKLEKRAKKNMMTLSEQIEDIVRRSCASQKTAQLPEKLDDTLVSLFSRRR